MFANSQPSILAMRVSYLMLIHTLHYIAQAQKFCWNLPSFTPVTDLSCQKSEQLSASVNPAQKTGHPIPTRQFWIGLRCSRGYSTVQMELVAPVLVPVVLTYHFLSMFGNPSVIKHGKTYTVNWGFFMGQTPKNRGLSGVPCLITKRLLWKSEVGQKPKAPSCNVYTCWTSRGPPQHQESPLSAATNRRRILHETGEWLMWPAQICDGHSQRYITRVDLGQLRPIWTYNSSAMLSINNVKIKLRPLELGNELRRSHGWWLESDRMFLQNASRVDQAGVRHRWPQNPTSFDCKVYHGVHRKLWSCSIMVTWCKLM